MNFYCGYSQALITPNLTNRVFMAGFGQGRQAASVHDDLFIRVLSLRSQAAHPTSEKRLVLVAFDLIGLPRLFCQQIEQAVRLKYPSVRTILAATHTHHGPDTIGLWGKDLTISGVDQSYMRQIQQDTVSAILTAISKEQPARVAAATTRVHGVVKNTRNPELIDNELACLQFIHVDTGAILVTVFDFPCHPEVLGEFNVHISSDYPGVLRREIETATKAPAVFLAGGLGGMLTPDVSEHTFEKADEMGKALARVGLEALNRPTCRASDPVLDFTSIEFSIPMTNLVFQMAMQSGLLLNTLNKSGEVVTETNLIKIGPIWLATVPGEILPRLGLALKMELIRRGALVSAIIGLANDEIGYILPKEDFAYPENPFKPGSHYEETMSVGAEAGPRLMTAARKLMQ